jgi:GLPGLI family protein
MKKILITIALIWPFLLSAQTNEGTIRYLITHNWVKKMAAVTYISQQQKDKMNYMYGNDSEWKKYANLYFNDTNTKYENSDENPNSEDYQYAEKKETFFITRDFTNNKAYDATSINGRLYVIEDSIPVMQWKILNDMKEVAGHVCMNATYTDSTHLHQVVAWFALDIPINAGPERFNGLPGCILEIDINDGAVVISADKVEMKKLNQEMALPKKKIKGKRVTEAEYQKALDEHYELARKNQTIPFWGLRY